MLNKNDIKKIVTGKMGEFLSPLGYNALKVKPDVVASFEKKDATCCYGFNCFVNSYNDFQLVYGFEFGVNKIVQILKDIESHVPLANYKYEVKDFITGISPGLLLDPLSIARAYKFFNTEEQLIAIIEEIKEFYKQQFVPFCEKFSNFSQVDKIINSFDDFWKDSNGKSMPISFFHVTRLIISKLANSPNYNEVVERNFQALEEIWKKDGGIYNRSDESKPEVFAANYLRNLKA